MSLRRKLISTISALLLVSAAAGAVAQVRIATVDLHQAIGAQRIGTAYGSTATGNIAVTATLAGSIESTIESLVSRMLADYIDPES